MTTNLTRRYSRRGANKQQSPTARKRVTFSQRLDDRDIRSKDPFDPFLGDPTPSQVEDEWDQIERRQRDHSSNQGNQGKRNYCPREEEIPDATDIDRHYRIYMEGLGRKLHMLPVDITELTYEIIDRKTFLLPEGPEFVLDVVKRAVPLIRIDFAEVESEASVEAIIDFGITQVICRSRFSICQTTGKVWTPSCHQTQNAGTSSSMAQQTGENHEEIQRSNLGRSSG